MSHSSMNKHTVPVSVSLGNISIMGGVQSLTMTDKLLFSAS